MSSSSQSTTDHAVSERKPYAPVPLLNNKNFLIYPGKLTVAETFRIGCIGNLNDKDMNETIEAVREVVKELIQNDLSTKNLKKELSKIVDGAERERILSDYKLLKEKLGGKGASQLAAKLIVKNA